jgi:hypothetical protein
MSNLQRISQQVTRLLSEEASEFVDSHTSLDLREHLMYWRGFCDGADKTIHKYQEASELNDVYHEFLETLEVE